MWRTAWQRRFHGAYRSSAAGSLHWGAAHDDGPSASPADFLDDLLPRFWERVRTAP